MKTKATRPFKIPRILITLLAIISAGMMSGCDRSQPPDPVDIVQALSEKEDLDCYARADRPRTIKFPEDLGAHEGFKTEWWYYTGNLLSDTGRHFGFQLTFFRQALACIDAPGESKWRSRQLYFAHFALTDTQTPAFYSAQRMNRGALGIAGAKAAPYKVWIDDWTAQEIQNALVLNAQDRAKANGRQTTEKIAIHLTLHQTKPAILQGEKGWSKKGAGPSDASYYYSFPGLAAEGSLTLGKETHKVRGRAWFDHEWSTSALGDRVRGWDWFAFNLSRGPHKGADIMVCQVRGPDGTPNAFGFGSISFADGSHAILTEDQFSIQPLEHWTSPRSNRKYPSQWTISLPGQGLELNASPVMADQEHAQDFPYYEGAVRIRGENSLGLGYVEMTGY